MLWQDIHADGLLQEGVSCDTAMLGVQRHLVLLSCRAVR